MLNNNIEEPLVSVAIITYNQKGYLKECIESVLAQDYDNIEIIVADDASTDGTQEMLIEYKIKYPNKFKYNLSEKNNGITKNCNNALFLCKGKYIAWLGGDDLFLPGKISKQVRYMESNQQVVLSYHNIDVFNSGNGKTLYFCNDVNPKYEGDVDFLVEYGTFMGACSVMVRREMCPERFNSLISISSDWLFWIETCYNGKIGYIDEVLSRYRKHSNNITNNINYEIAIKEKKLTLDLVDKDKLKNSDSISKGKARIYYNYALEFIKINDIKYKYMIRKSIESYKLGKKQTIVYLLVKFNLTWIYKLYYELCNKSGE